MMCRALLLACCILSSPCVLAGPTVSAYLQGGTIVVNGTLSRYASETAGGLMVDVRYPLTTNVWIGGYAAQMLMSSAKTHSLNVGMRSNTWHDISGFAFVGYGWLKTGFAYHWRTPTEYINGNGLSKGIGATWEPGKYFVAELAWLSLFDGEMSLADGSPAQVEMSGPRFGLGLRF